MAANKITISNTLAIAGANGSASAPGSDSIDQIGSHFVENVQTFTGGAWEAIFIGDIATLGYLHLKNNDAVNYVEIATANDNSGIFAKVLAGRTTQVAVKAAVTYYVRANTANVDCTYLAIEL
jgi:hypothetical protein